jgi:hypothetical protein
MRLKNKIIVKDKIIYINAFLLFIMFSFFTFYISYIIIYDTYNKVCLVV